MTHEQYMDEPKDTIEWTIRIASLFDAEEKRREEAAHKQTG